MFNFLFGYFFGSSYSENEGNGVGGGILGIILMIVLGIIAYNIILFYYGYSDINTDTKLVAVVKYYFYPSMWDVYHNVGVGHSGIKTWLMIVNFVASGFAILPIVLPITFLFYKHGELGLNIGLLVGSVLAIPNMIWVFLRFIYYIIKVLF